VDLLEEYFDLHGPDIPSGLIQQKHLWHAIRSIPDLLIYLLRGSRIIKGDVSPHAVVEDGPMYIGHGSRIEPGAYVACPAYIGDGVVLRHGAYVRENCIFLGGSLLGHASEAKGSIFLPGAKAPHFAYVGDSILGRSVNLGAGTKLSNVPITSSRSREIEITFGDETVNTGLRKLGAILGDDVQVGCNAVLNPGTIIGPRSIVYANASVPKGFYPADTIIKLRQTHELNRRIKS
jgi:UDP-N-acetylglucosamine diphosphorylase / glucose-1-phosphate thymidylyltransferase / UDP-N-acetylgalactosamine diphosphorylase / glucosamine-1-phosphate N-acetyltransferase / galactosamine-1-phosphate N-acetyltransferase